MEHNIKVTLDLVILQCKSQMIEAIKVQDIIKLSFSFTFMAATANCKVIWLRIWTDNLDPKKIPRMLL